MSDRRIVSAEELPVVDGIDPRMLKVTRDDGSVSFVPFAEGNREYEALHAAVAARTLTVSGARLCGLTRNDVTARDARRAAELEQQRSR